MTAKLQERLAKLSGGVAIIRVGAATETELKEKKHRVEDALSATRAAVEEGIVPGGGVALVNAVESLKELKLDQEDAQIGVNIVRNALTVPMKKIVENAGQDGSVVVENVRQRQAEANNHHIGYNVLTEEYGDMVELGVIDPANGYPWRARECCFHRCDDPDHRSSDHRYSPNRPALPPPQCPPLEAECTKPKGL